MITLRIEGYSLRRIAKLFGSTLSTVYKIWHRFYDNHDTEPVPRNGRPTKLLKEDIGFLFLQIQRNRSVLYSEI